MTRLLLPMAVAAVISSAGAQPMHIMADFARFRGDDRSMFIEVYYAVSQKGLTLLPDSGGFRGTADMTMLVMRADSIVYADRWLVPHVVGDTSGSRGDMNLVGVTSVALTEGDYVLRLIGRDRAQPDRADSVTIGLPVRNIRPDSMDMSDIELASTIRRADPGGPFYKNTLDVIPNVQGVYGEDNLCYLYAEGYNLLKPTQQGNYAIKILVFDAVGKEVVSRERPRKRTAESTVIVDNIPAANLRTGTYTLVVGLLDSNKAVMASRGKKFFVYNKTLGVDSSLLNLTNRVLVNEYAGMEEPAMDQEFSWTRYEATEPERTQYEKISGVEAKRKFLTDFWNRRPAGRKQEYMARVAFANANYRALGREGFRTDRGRVFITYGQPDDFERHPSEAEYRPYEIWSYNNIQGGVIFVFVQRSTGGDYDLVHSTHRNELHDENWERYARTQ